MQFRRAKSAILNKIAESVLFENAFLENYCLKR